MSEQRPSVAYLLLLVLALGAWCLHDAGRLAGAAAVIGLVLASYRFPALVLRPGAMGVFAGSALLMAFCQFVVFAGEPVMHVSIYSFRVVQSLCLSLVVLSAAQWLCWRSRRFDWLLFSLGSLIMLSGVSWETLRHKPVYIALVLGFMGVLMFFRLFPRLRTHHGKAFKGKLRILRSYYLRMFALLGLFLSLSVVTIGSMEAIDRRVSELLTRFLVGNERDWSGFSGHTHLQGGREIQLSEQIAFTVQAPLAMKPDLEYWRGNILTVYRDGHWFPQETLHLPVAARSDGETWDSYRVDPALNGHAGQTVEVRMQNHYQGILFAPAATSLVEVPARTSLYQNQYQLFRRELHSTRHAYRLQLRQDAPALARWDRNMLNENLELPSEIARELAPMARELTRGAVGPLEKAARIEAWFHLNFVYSLKVGTVTPGVDPTLDFVRNRKPAYCSWFASGMVLMLRSVGVPAHVVSGWRSLDWNAMAQIWVVKEKEAHDWVEILDPGQNRWVRFDPTPPGQLAEISGSGRQSAWWAQLGDGFGLLTQRLQQQLAGMSLQQRLAWLREAALSLLRQPGFYLALLALLGLNHLLKLRRRPRPAPPQPEPLAYAGATPELSLCLDALARWLAPQGLSLPTDRTLEAWLPEASRDLDPVAAAALARVVALLVALRFGPGPMTRLPELRTAIANLPVTNAQGASPAAQEAI